MTPLTCSVCGTELVHTRRTIETRDHEAAGQGWTLGLPRQQVLCPLCTRAMNTPLRPRE